MAFLASWLQQLILVVIMAAFLDLLLPNNTMQRYVRLVMGLVILMLILSPLLTLLKNDWDIDSVLATEQTPIDAELESLPHIQETADHLQQKQQQWVGESVQRNIEKQISSAIEQEFGTPVRDVAVTLSDDGGQTSVSEVLLTIGENDTANKDIASVDPIRITIGEEQEARETFSTAQTDASSRFLEIRQWISREWHVDEADVHVAIAGEEG